MICYFHRSKIGLLYIPVKLHPQLRIMPLLTVLSNLMATLHLLLTLQLLRTDIKEGKAPLFQRKTGGCAKRHFVYHSCPYMPTCGRRLPSSEQGCYNPREVFYPMSEILRNKNLATKFQILVEVAANQPNIQQREIAKKLDITPQAVSEYVMKMEEEGWVSSGGRSRYKVTQEGVNWVLKSLRELEGYASFVRKAMTNVTISAAVADCDLSQGQPVGLIMKEGLLFATSDAGEKARGIAIGNAKKGEDVGISNIEGVVELQRGKITLLRVPDIQGGGSGGVNVVLLRNIVSREGLVGAVGIEALIALRRGGIEPNHFQGVAEAAIEASHTGLSYLIVCVEDAIPDVVRKLEDAGSDYELWDL